MVLYAVRQCQAQSHHELWRGRHCPRAADLRRNGEQDADEVLRGSADLQRVTYLPHVRGRRSVQRHQGGDLDQGEATRIQAAPGLELGPQRQALAQELGGAEGQFGQRGPRSVVDLGLGYHVHDQVLSVALTSGAEEDGTVSQRSPALARDASPAADGTAMSARTW